jgi:hypothetical protein
VLDDGQPGLRLALAAFGRQVHLCGLLRYRLPIEIGGEPFPGRPGAPLRGVWIV